MYLVPKSNNLKKMFFFFERERDDYCRVLQMKNVSAEAKYTHH